jgi:hypothetical protein
MEPHEMPRDHRAILRHVGGDRADVRSSSFRQQLEDLNADGLAQGPKDP